ncbi:MAG: metallophosphoesterase family protein, partial [Gemmatimonadaceae bacterium]
LSYEFTRGAVSEESKRELRSVPFLLDLRPLGGHVAGPRLVLVHGTTTLNTVYWTEDRSDEFCLKMARVVALKAGDAIAFGHTHKPWHRTIEGIHFINTGSVGRPKDGDARAGYVRITFSASDVQVEHVRVPYDVEGAAAAVLAAGLPQGFAEFLRTGGGVSVA